MTAHHRLRRAGIGGLAAVVSTGTALALGVAPANAAFTAGAGQIGILDTNTTTAGTQGATAVTAGTTGTALDSVQLLVPNTCASGDAIALTLAAAGPDPSANLDAAHTLAYSAAPTVTVDPQPYKATSKIGPSSSDTSLVKDATAGATTTAPAFTVALSSSGANTGRGKNDQATLTNTATCGGTDKTDLFLVTVSAKVDTGASVAPGAIHLTPSATDAPLLPLPILPGAPKALFAAGAYTVPGFVLPASITVADPSSIKADGTTQAVGDITVKELTTQGMGAGTYTVAINGADIKNDNSINKVTATLTSAVTGESLDNTVATVKDAHTLQFKLNQADPAASALGTTVVKLSGVLLSSTSNANLTYTLAGGTIDAALATPAAPANQTDIAAPVVQARGTSLGQGSRISGLDRYATAAQIALTNANGQTAPAMVVAAGQSYPDALSAAFLTQRLGNHAGVLLTRTDSLPAVTSSALAQLSTSTVYVVGGTSAVSDTVLAQLQAAVGPAGKVIRLAGADRYATNQKVDGTAMTIGTDPVGSTQVTFGKAAQKTALLATGQDFADALAASPATRGASNSTPIPLLLTRSTSLSPEAQAQLTGLGIGQVVIAGGPSAVSTTVESQLTAMGISVLRVAGADRYETATKVADFEVGAVTPTSATTTGGLGFVGVSKTLYLATGEDYADALAGGPLAASDGAPVLLTRTATLPAITQTWLTGHKSAYSSVTALGGPAAVSDAVLAAAQQALL